MATPEPKRWELKCHLDHYALSALGNLIDLYLGRWPRLLHFAPSALRSRILTQPLALWAIDIPSASPTGYQTTAQPDLSLLKLSQSLFNLLQQSVGMIARDQRDVFVGPQLRK